MPLAQQIGTRGVGGGGQTGVVSRFSPATQDWLDGAFAAPTPAQLGAWDAIARGEHTLVVAPTGSGKTLAAFLSALNVSLRLHRSLALGWIRRATQASGL